MFRTSICKNGFKAVIVTNENSAPARAVFDNAVNATDHKRGFTVTDDDGVVQHIPYQRLSNSAIRFEEIVTEPTDEGTPVADPAETVPNDEGN